MTISAMTARKLGFSPTQKATSPQQRQRSLVVELAQIVCPNDLRKVQIAVVNKAVSQFYPQITERRIRSMFDGDCAAPRLEETDALVCAIQTQKAKRDAKRFDAITQALAIELAKEGAPLDRHQSAALGRIKHRLALRDSDAEPLPNPQFLQVA